MVRGTKEIPFPAYLIDTREQNPYPLEPAVRTALPSGDYSLDGFAGELAIERKSKADAYSSLFRDRSRFEREIERLAALRFAAVVIECNLPEFLRPPPFSGANPIAAACTVMSWMVRYRVPFIFAGDRRHGISATISLLKFYWLNREKEKLEEKLRATRETCSYPTMPS